MNFRGLSSLTFLIIFCLPQFTFGQDGDLRADIEAFIVKEVAGEEVLESADVANPGDVILYQATFENRGDSVLSEIKPTIPIPASLVYVDGSAKPEPQAFSVDGVNFRPFPALDSAGEPMDPAAIRALRWHLETLEAESPFNPQLRAKLVD